MTDTQREAYEKECKLYGFEGKPLQWQNGFTKGFNEGYQAALAHSQWIRCDEREMMKDSLGEIVLRTIGGTEKVYKVPDDVSVAVRNNLEIQIALRINELKKDTPKMCPHADPFVYCSECVVKPCPLGLNHD